MGTPMYVYAEIAARHGVDQNDVEAVDNFFAVTALELPRKAQKAIFDELVARNDEVRKDGEPPAPVMSPEIGLADLVKRLSDADLYGQFFKHYCAQHAESPGTWPLSLTPAVWLQTFAEFVSEKAKL